MNSNRKKSNWISERNLIQSTTLNRTHFMCYFIGDFKLISQFPDMFSMNAASHGNQLENRVIRIQFHKCLNNFVIDLNRLNRSFVFLAQLNRLNGNHLKCVCGHHNTSKCVVNLFSIIGLEYQDQVSIGCSVVSSIFNFKLTQRTSTLRWICRRLKTKLLQLQLNG